jgi:hypothetical protein
VADRRLFSVIKITKMPSQQTYQSLGKWSRLTLATFSFLVIHQSTIFAQQVDSIEWGDRSDFMLTNPPDRTNDSLNELRSLSESNETVTQNFSITEIPDFSSIEPVDSTLLASELPDAPNTDSSESRLKLERESEDKKWFFTIYGGTGTNSSLGQTLTGKTSEFYDSFFNGENYIGLEVGRKIANLGKNFQIEVTGQARQHFNEADYLALETALVLRWHIARNSNFLNASLAVGDGLSYVTDLPQVEANRPNTFKKSNLLNYVLIETAFSLPKNPNWSLVLRLNHRSGVFGIFNGARDGSNNLSVGIRHSF